MVQADLALGLLEAFLDRPAGPGHPDQPDKGGAGRAGAGVEGRLVKIGGLLEAKHNKAA